jgi:hypothetical protein
VFGLELWPLSTRGHEFNYSSKGCLVSFSLTCQPLHLPPLRRTLRLGRQPLIHLRVQRRLRSVRGLGLPFTWSATTFPWSSSTWCVGSGSPSSARTWRTSSGSPVTRPRSRGGGRIRQPECSPMMTPCYFDHHTLSDQSRRNPSHWPDFIPGYMWLLFSLLKKAYPSSESWSYWYMFILKIS